MNFERKNKILEMLRANGVVMLKDLRKLFPDVSEMTLRRDLEYFEKSGEAVRIKGGARCSSFDESKLEEVFTKRLVQNAAAKEKIARIALQYVETGRSMFVDSGSTMLAFTKGLPDKKLNIITNGPHIAVEAAKIPGVNITLVGGMFNRDSQSVSGAQSTEFIKNIKFDIAFMSASAVSDQGCTQGNLSECELKNHIMRQAKQRIILADSSKFGKTMPFCFATFSDIDIIVTDKRPDDGFLFNTNIYGIKVIWD
ncbi:MAG: DeoR/GlpR family DNA-binding transcription regulator [Acutalibacteraceae bacterium]